MSTQNVPTGPRNGCRRCPRHGDLPGIGLLQATFYQWKRNPVSQRDWDDASPRQRAWDVHQTDPAVGYRSISDELNQAGLKAGENRVWRLGSQQRLWFVFAKKRGLVRKAGPPVHYDHVKRKFAATRPNQPLLTDITEHRPVPLERTPAGPEEQPHHRIDGPRPRVRASATTPRWSRSSRCRRRTSSTGNSGPEEELRLATVIWIARTYHWTRWQRRLGKLTPIEFETINLALNAACNH